MHRTGWLCLLLVSVAGCNLNSLQASDAAPVDAGNTQPTRKTIVFFDFSKPEYCNLRDPSSGEFIDSPDGKGRCFSFSLNYSKPRAIVAAWAALLLPQNAYYEVSPYTWIEFEVYFEGNQDPGMWINAGSPLSTRYPHGIMRVENIKSGEWQTRTLNVSSLTFDSSPGRREILPLPGDRFTQINFYSDERKKRGIRKMMVRNIHIYEEDKLAGTTDPNAKDATGETRLHLAAFSGEIKKVKELLGIGAAVDIRNNNRETPLHLAARGGYGDIVELLLANKAQVDATNGGNQTPLHYAASYGQAAAAKALIGHGADVKAADSQGRSPFFVALNYGNADVVDALLDTKMWTASEEVGGSLPIQVAAWGAEWQRTDEPTNAKRRRIVDLLLSRGATMDIFSAASIGDIAAAEKLVRDNPALTKTTNSQGWTALHNAAGRGRLDIAKLLVRKGADVNAKVAGSNLTPLHFACMPQCRYNTNNEQCDVAEYLLTHGADINAADRAEHTPLWFARDFGFNCMIDILNSNDALLDLPKAPEKPPPPPKSDF